MKRKFYDVVDAIIEVVPETEAAFHAALRRLKADAWLILPEDEFRWWSRLQDILWENIPAGPLNDWQKLVAAIVRGGVVVTKKYVVPQFKCRHCGDVHELMDFVKAERGGAIVFESACPLNGKLITLTPDDPAALFPES
jgi:hypothetical protein